MFAKVMAIVKSRRDAKNKDLLKDEQVIGDEVAAIKETKIDSFFVDSTIAPSMEVEKRAVMRDGRIPMM